MPDDLFASPRSRTVALLLAFFLGWFGAHRFYAGKIQTGILQALTLGGLGIWWLYDNIMILAGSFRDKEGLLIANWEPESDRMVQAGTAGAIFDELDQLRSEVAHLHERLDFAERLLVDPERGPRPER
ncbi:MAG TPA: TM2 domain-containing protein [Gemmatimonadales bacterium]|nr:TM2 domain-containing protein [Gemmatimonadales bacterium]